MVRRHVKGHHRWIYIVFLWLFVCISQAGTITVTNKNDSGAGSLRQAISSAVPGDTISLTNLSGTIVLTSGELPLYKNLTIAGPGADVLAISGNNVSRVFNITGGTVVISHLALVNGFAFGGGILHMSGGGIATISDCEITGSQSGNSGGGIYRFSGDLTLTRCLIYNNSTTYGPGGGIYSDTFGSLIMNSCTISGNTSAWGGGVAGYNATLNGCTVTGNTGTNYGAGGIAGDGGSIFIKNTIVLGNSDNGNGWVDVYGVDSGGYNIIGNDYEIDNRFQGTDLINTYNSLLSLADNGGSVRTHALDIGSPAINFIPVGDGSFNGAPTADGRDYPRIGNYDCGSYEYSSSSCMSPDVPAVAASPSSIFSGNSSTLTITGNLNDATAWNVYSDSCGGTFIGSTSTSSFTVSPSSTTTYYIRGEGGCVTPGSCVPVTVYVNYPEMDLSQSVTPIADGGSVDFGNQLTGSNTDVVFTITNSGTADLNLTTPVTVGGSNEDQFSIQVQPSPSVAGGGGTTTFTIRFSPTSAGVKTATIAIGNNDSNENPYDLTITGTGTIPEMNLSQGVTLIADGGSVDFGSQLAGSDTDLVFTISNTGTGDLNLITPVTISGANDDQFSIQVQPLSPVTSGGGTTTFTVRFSPTSTGAKTATIAVGNNDSDENPYNLTLTGTGITPEIDLTQGATPIADGGTFDFGSLHIGLNSNEVFTITNSGTASLILTTPLVIEGTDADQFSIETQPSTPVSEGGGTTSFTVIFSPTSLGTKTATLSIVNNDLNENPYNVTINGTGTGTEIDLFAGSSPFSDGDVFDFASIRVGTQVDQVFNIMNSGNVDLNISTPVNVTGPDADQFSIEKQPETPVLSSGENSTSFIVRFSPTSIGTKTAVITIENDDTDENPYDINLTGVGYGPEIEIFVGGVPFNNGEVFDFENHFIGTMEDQSFIILNTGDVDLNLRLPVDISGPDAEEFSIERQPDELIAPTGENATSLIVRFYPTSIGFKTAKVILFCDDSDESQFEILLTGNGVAPEMDLYNDINLLSDGYEFDVGKQAVGLDTDVVFIVENTGNESLIITTPISINGEDANQFSVPIQPLNEITAGSSSSFTIRFSPTSRGIKQAFISIRNNDSDENTYDLLLTGEGVVTPSLTTQPISGVTSSIASCGGNITDNGGSSVMSRGVCWSTSPDPTTGDSMTTDGTGSGIFISSITGLTPATVYYVRAYASNMAGTAYGNQLTFTTLNQYTVIFISGGNGILSGTPLQKVDHGFDCTPVTADPAVGYHFLNWTGDLTSANNPLTINNVTSDMTVTANFKINQYTVTFMPGENGTLTGTTLQTIDHGSDCTSVTADPAVGYHFLNWTGDLTSTNNPLTINNVISDMTVTANFKINQYTVTFMPGENGTLTGTTLQTIDHGSDSTSVTADPAVGYHFLNWTGDLTSTNNPLTISNVISDMSVTANFSLNTYTILVTSGANGSTNKNGSNSVSYGENFSLVFYPDTGYLVDTVSVDGTLIDPKPTFTFRNVTENHTLHVTFKKDELPIVESFTATPVSGFTPLDVTFTLNAHDPDGSDIIAYHWDFDGDGVVDKITDSSMVVNRYYDQRSYNPTAFVQDAQGNLVFAEGPVINGWRPYQLVFGLDFMSPRTALPGQSTESTPVDITEGLKIDNWIINMTDSENMITLDGLDSEGNYTEQVIITQSAHGKKLLTSSLFSSLETLYVKSTTTQRTTFACGIKGENSYMASWLPVPLSDRFFIPHIAEETDFWDSYSVISLSEERELSFQVQADTSIDEKTFVSCFNLNPMVEGIESEDSWGTVHAYDPSPGFMEPRVMSGYEMFVKKGSDGAAIELIDKGSEQIYIPHIPIETDLFWTGFTFMNVEEYPVTSHVTFYNSQGGVCGEFDMELAPGVKVKGLIDKLFEGMNGIAEWGQIESTGKIIAVELYGTFDSGICGYGLPYGTQTTSALPFVMTDDGWWNGISITNPHDNTVTVTINIRDEEGDIVAVMSQDIAAFSKFKGTLDELFPENTFSERNYIELISPAGVLAIEVCGTYDWGYMQAIGGAE